MKRALLMCIVVSGCGSEPATTAVNGTAELDSFPTANAIYDETSNGNIAILLSDDATACDRVSSGLLLGDAGATEAGLLLVTRDEHFWNNDTRTIGDDLDAFLSTPRLPDGGCVVPVDGGFECEVVHPTSGTVHLARVDDNMNGGVAAGDFKLVFPDGNTLSGSFHAQPCTQLTGCPAGTSAFALPLLGLGLRRRRHRRA